MDTKKNGKKNTNTSMTDSLNITDPDNITDQDNTTDENSSQKSQNSQNSYESSSYESSSQSGSQNGSQNGSPSGSQNDSLRGGSQSGSQNGSQSGSQNGSQNSSQNSSQSGSQLVTHEQKMQWRKKERTKIKKEIEEANRKNNIYLFLNIGNLQELPSKYAVLFSSHFTDLHSKILSFASTLKSSGSSVFSKISSVSSVKSNNPELKNYNNMNSIFNIIYIILMILIIVLFVIFIIFIIILPFLFFADNYNDYMLTKTNNYYLPTKLLSKYFIYEYIWCNYDEYFNKFMNIFKYKFYTPIVIIYIISILIYIITVIMLLHLILIFGLKINSDVPLPIPDDLINNIIRLGILIIILVIFWVFIYNLFKFAILDDIIKIRNGNNEINNIINSIITDSIIFPEIKHLDELLDKALVKQNKEGLKIIMLDHFTVHNIKDNTEARKKFGLLYLILEYFIQHNENYQKASYFKFDDFIMSLKEYFKNPLISKDSLISFTCEKDPLAPWFSIVKKDKIHESTLKTISGSDNFLDDVDNFNHYSEIVKYLLEGTNNIRTSKIQVYISVLLIIALILIFAVLNFM